MSRTHRIAASLLVVLLGLAAPAGGGTLFRCRFDATVREACCCPDQTDPDPASHSIASACCA
jgi:hypothetical protein